MTKEYTSIEVAQITGLSRPYLSAICKEQKVQMVKNKYLLSVNEWVNILTPKHRSKFLDHAFEAKPLKYVPIFYGVLRITETYEILPSKMNYTNAI